MSAAEHVTDSLNKIAELDLDLTQTVYQQYFTRCPAASEVLLINGLGEIQIQFGNLVE